MRVLHGLLELLQKQVSEASMRRVNLDSQEALVVDRAVRRHHEEKNRMKREKAEEARRRKESWAAWLEGKMPRWMMALCVDT